ncbi:MAG: DNA polymerase III subunit gamma/tau [Verrucomicrobiota bacterium]
MSYQVLARKYRPQTFSELIGQDHVVRTLTNAIETGRIAHAFLFVGPRGIGKTSTARILAKALNAQDGPRVDFDPEEETSREIAEGRSMDVIEIDGASNNNVDQIRELRDNVQYAPTRGNYKIYIIDEVHMLSQAAFNALLKTLEEPPAHVKFIFATTEPHKVLPTILSRCQRFDLKRISDQDIAKQLNLIAKQESITVDPLALKIIARNAEGGMRDAESAFDQLISFCGNKIEEKDVLEVFGLTGHQEIWSLAEAIQAGKADPALHQVRELVNRGKDLSRLTQELLRYFRNLLLYIISPDIAQQELDENELHHYQAMEPLPSRSAILAIIDELILLEEKIRYALVKEVLFEIAVIRMAQQKEKVSIEEVIQVLSSGQPLEKITIPEQPRPRPTPSANVPTQEDAAPTPEPSPAPASTPSPAPEPEAPSSPNIDAEAAWQKVCKSARAKELILRRALLNTRINDASSELLDITLITTRDTYQSLVNSSGSQILEKEVKKEFGPSTRLKLTLEEHEEPTPAPVPTPEEAPAPNASEAAAPKEEKAEEKQPAAPAPDQLSKAEFENDPLIRKALEEFEARIVEIKSRP